MWPTVVNLDQFGKMELLGNAIRKTREKLMPYIKDSCVSLHPSVREKVCMAYEGHKTSIYGMFSARPTPPDSFSSMREQTPRMRSASSFIYM